MAVDTRKTALFETTPVPRALFTMAVPTIISQLISLALNMADTWFIGRANNPYMVAASSLVLTVFLMAGALSNLFGVGGGSLMVRLLTCLVFNLSLCFCLPPWPTAFMPSKSTATQLHSAFIFEPHHV